MSDNVVTSTTVWIGFITAILLAVKYSTGIDFPLSPEQILGAALALVEIVRVFKTDKKIVSILPKKESV